MKINDAEKIKKEIYTISGLAIKISRTENSVRISLSRGEEGESIPKSFKLGRRRLWLRSEVDKFIANLGGEHEE